MHTHGAPDGSSDELIHGAGRYDLRLRLRWRRDRRWRADLLDQLDLRPGQRVLDIGSGSGQLAFALADRVTPGGTVDGVDGAAEMVELARRKNLREPRPVTFAVSRAQQLPFPDAGFDAVTGTLVLHHVAVEERRTAVAEISRVLRPGGRVLIADFVPARPRWFAPRRPAHHADALAEAAGLLEAAGFVDLRRGPTTARGIGRVVATRPA